MDNRDNIMEEQLKNSYEQMPESLRPDNIEKRLLAMTQEERYNRSMSKDIPEDTGSKKSSGKGSKKSSNKKIVLPIVIAASVLLAAGVGTYFLLNRETSKAVVSDQGLAVTPEGNKEEKESTENYKKSYRLLKDYNKYLNEMKYIEYDVDMVEEEADDMNVAESTEAMLNSDQTLGADRKKSAGVQTGEETTPSFTDTNVRTEGVNEADIIKTDGKYMYVYDDYTEHLNIYSVEDGNIDKIGTLNVLSDGENFNEMYINGDKLVLLGSSYSRNTLDATTTIAVFDISDRTEPKKEKSFVQDGLYESSRMVGNIVYTFSEKRFDLDRIKRRNYVTYVPKVDGEVLDNSELFIQEKCCTDSYLVSTSVDISSVEIVDKMAVLGGADKYYVSSENMYFIDRDYDWNSFGYQDNSNIVRISYKDGDFKFGASGSFPGYLNDDYSIDEYNGYVRIVSTYRDEDYTQYNGLYIYDTDLKQVSVIKKLAEGETIRSARFMGESAYFVTFRNTDPLFAVDLSDPENPRITDYLKIPGFSAYMHPYGDDMLLGIGYETDENGWGNTIKLSMFDVSDPYNIEEVDKVVLHNFDAASVLNDRRAFMFNSEDGTFGFSAEAAWTYIEEDWYEEAYGDEYEDWDDIDFEKSGYYYEVFDYDENKGFVNLMDEKLGDVYDSLLGTRGIVIGDYIYVVESGNKITSYDTENYKMVDECY